MKNKKVLYITLAIIVLFIGVYSWRGDLQNLFAYDLGDGPTHKSHEECLWLKRAFEKAGITAFVANCTNEDALDQTTGYAMIFYDTEKKVVGKWVTNSDYQFTIQVYDKQESEIPLDVLKEWYVKLTPEQQRKCEIQEADEPLQYFSDGRLMVTEDPHPTKHKTRYKIDIRPEVVKQIWDQYDGDPGGGEGRDYMCGRLVGTAWGSHTPYFEFDDRSLDKYLLIGTYGQEGPFIDLNSIRF